MTPHGTRTRQYRLFIYLTLANFTLDLITPPMALPSIEPTVFDDLEDVKTVRRDLEQLSAGARGAEYARKRHQQTLNDFKRLLDPNSLPEYKFKTSKRTRKGSQEQEEQPSKPQLSAFADRVYNDNHVAFSYVTPDASPESEDNIVVKHRRPSSPGDNIVVTPRKTHQPSKQQAGKKQPVEQTNMRGSTDVRQAGDLRTIKLDSLPQARKGYVGEPHVAPSPKPHPTPKAFVLPANLTPAQLAEYRMVSPRPTPTAFAVPATLTPAQRAEHEKVPEPRDTTPSRNQSAYLTNGARMMNLGQRQKADTAVENMQSLLQSIFEAEDHLQPDTSGDTSMHENEFFVMEDSEDSSTPLLTNDALLKLDAAVTKVYAVDRIDSIEVEHLARVQKLCETYLATAYSGPLDIGDEWEEQDIQSWLGKVSSAHHGLIAVRTMMRIMAGGFNQKKLQSEDHLRLVLDTVQGAVEGCIIPIIEMRSTTGEKIRGDKGAPRNPAFEIAVEHRKILQTFMKLTTRCVQLLGELFFRTDVDETGISSLELLCKTLIFAENASSDRDAALGTQGFEDLRRAAMDGLARIFEKYTSERTAIVDDMLSSLDNLPTTKQSARQYTLPDAKPIQLVSALLIRLVQTSATADLRKKATAEKNEEEDGDSDESEEYDSEDLQDELSNSKKQRKDRPATSKAPPSDLAALYQPLKKSAGQYASYIVQIILDRAQSSSKSSDEPFRRLLDIFVDDFLNVMGSTDWPAAELLLRALVSKLITLTRNQKSPAPSRTLALELLGTIGSGILDLRKTASDAAQGLDIEDPLSARLAKVAKVMKSDDMSISALTAFEGPYRVVIEYLDARDIEKDPKLQSARGFHLMQWADFVCENRESTPDGNGNTLSSKALQTKIKYMIEDPHWLSSAEPDFPQPSTDQGKLAGKLVAANSLLCKAFTTIFDVILRSLSSEQPTVRSRSLKSVNTLLEQDPAVLDREVVLHQILHCLGDASSLVRDSALGLLQKCVSLRPALELRVYHKVVPRTNDAAVGVRKRAMAFLKQVYLNNEDNAVRAAISNALISRVQDNEESVAEVARTTIEEVWFSSFRQITSDDRSVNSQIKLSSHALLIIATVELGDNVATVLQKMVKKLLTESKTASENVRVSKMFVRVIFDLISQDHVPGNPSKAAVTRTLEVFAKAWPKLFTPDQLSHLEPWTRNLSTTEDLEIFAPVVNILRHTLPVVIGVDKDKLSNLMTALMSSVSKVPKSELAVIAPCVATIDVLLGGTERPLSLYKSILVPLSAVRQAQTVPGEKELRPVIKRLNILGQFGKSCNIDHQLPALKNLTKSTWYKGDSVAGLLIEIICYFTSPKQPLGIREAAIEAVCEICYSFPEHFERADVVNAIEAVFHARTQSLEAAMLSSLENFFAAGVAGADEQPEIAAGIEGGAQRLGGTYKATGHDKASAALSQRFLSQFLRIALSSVDDVALTAARIVVHINTSGLSYPQDSAPGLVALETCPNNAIAGLAFKAHKEQFSKYESIFEKQLVKAVQRAFEYQVEVLKSPPGCTGNPPTPKLHFFWDVAKTGKAMVRQKFATNICASMNFDPSKLKLQGSSSPHLMYVRFCIENIAFFDYATISELQHLLAQLEKTVAGTGTEVAQMIESEVLNIQVPATSSSIPDQGPDGIVIASTEPVPVPQANIEPKRLEQLTVSAQVLSLVWQTRIYLNKIWNMNKHTGKAKAASKEASKVAHRIPNTAGPTESFQRLVNSFMAPRETDEAQKQMCKSFVELYTVDAEVKVGSEDEDNMVMDVDGDARSAGSSTKSPSVGATPSRGKKRKSVDPAGGPKKRGRPRKFSVAKKDSDDEDGGWD